MDSVVICYLYIVLLVVLFGIKILVAFLWSPISVDTETDKSRDDQSGIVGSTDSKDEGKYIRD